MSAGRWGRLGLTVVVSGLMSLTAAGVAAAAESPVEGTAGIAKDGQGRDSYRLYDRSGGTRDAALITLSLDGKAVEAYCIDLKHPLKQRGTYQETAWKSSTVKNLDMVQWLLVHSVPNVTAKDVLKTAGVKQPESVKDGDLGLLVYAATQGAIWHFSDDLDVVGHPGDDYTVVKGVYDYFVANAGKLSEPAATLRLTPANATGEVGAKAGPYTVRSSSPATLGATDGKVVDANGAELTGPVADGGKFWLTRNGTGKVTVDATATGKVPTGRVFTHTPHPNEFQKIILAGVGSTKLTAQATATFTPKGAAAPGVPTLPVTGASAVGAAVAGLLLLVGGGLLVVLLRRRRVKFSA